MSAKNRDNRRARRAQSSIDRSRYQGPAEEGAGSSRGGGPEFRDRTGKVHKLGSGGGGGPSRGPGHGPAHPKGAATRGHAQASPQGPQHASKPGAGRTPTHERFDYMGEPVVTTATRKNALPGARGEKPARPERESRFDRPLSRPGRPERPERGGRPEREQRARGGFQQQDDIDLDRRRATVDKNAKGFAFLSFERRGVEPRPEDAFINPRDAQSLFHGDRVEVIVNSRNEVVDLKVIEHRFREIVGRFNPHPSGAHKGGWLVYERKRAREEVWIPKVDPRLKPGAWIRAKLVFHDEGPFAVTAEVTEIFGETLPASSDIAMVAAEYNLVEEHSPQAEAEARSFKLEIPGKDLQGREDLRKVPFITIDGETARDFDDAVYVEPSKSGFTLWVAIADVSHYVTEGSALDREARSRGTSVYFPERAFHMLPRALSESLCSLKPNEPRLAMVARMEFDRKGERLRTEIMEAVIDSHRRATYTEISSEHDDWESTGRDPSWEYAPHFALYALLRQQRLDRGSIDFDLPEAEVRVDSKTGEVISILERPRLHAHRLIEEFMIAANEAVTVWAMEKGWPFIFRIHDDPAEEKLIKFQQLAAHVGVNFSLSKAGISPKAMADLIKKLEGHPAQSMLNIALLRSLKQAVYSAEHGEHYGLASEAYTHFTSPIRRYPDLVVHRILRMALRAEKGKGPKLDPAMKKKLERDLTEAAEHCSYRERIAADADREATRLKQVRAMIPRVGDEFDGKVTGMIEAGLFIQIHDPYVEGLVAKDTLNDDFYQFNETKMEFRGSRTKKLFKIGDPVRVRCLRADIDSRTIDFGILDEGREPSMPAAPFNRDRDKRGGGGGGGGGRNQKAGRPGKRGERGGREGSRDGGDRSRDDRGGSGGRGGKKKFAGPRAGGGGGGKGGKGGKPKRRGRR